VTDHRQRFRLVGGLVASVRDLIILARPVASLCAGLELLVGARLMTKSAGISADSVLLIREGAAIALVTAAVNTVNDIRDILPDAISRPNRPLAAGRLSVATAWAASGAEALTALILSADARFGLPLAVLLLTIGVAYSYALKGIVLFGNFVVASLAATPIVYGAWLGDARPAIPLLAGLAIFLFMFSFEVLKTIRDVTADSSVACRTVATEWGPHAAALIFQVFLVLYAIVATVPMLIAGASVPYLVIMCLGSVIPCLTAGLRLPVDRSPPAVRQMLRIMAISWVPGLLALALISDSLWHLLGMRQATEMIHIRHRNPTWISVPDRESS
jgi:geranylgeranylglycerol-phosphate geranylgeranyltransferase